MPVLSFWQLSGGNTTTGDRPYCTARGCWFWGVFVIPAPPRHLAGEQLHTQRHTTAYRGCRGIDDIIEGTAPTGQGQGASCSYVAAICVPNESPTKKADAGVRIVCEGFKKRKWLPGRVVWLQSHRTRYLLLSHLNTRSTDRKSKGSGKRGRWIITNKQINYWPLLLFPQQTGVE